MFLSMLDPVPDNTSRSAAGASDPRLLLLAEADNVLVITARIRAGETIQVEGAAVVVPSDLPLGHKIARRAIRRGEKVVKYGAPIGSATDDIACGSHVHVHNVKSDYTPTYHLDEARERFAHGA